MSGGFSLRTLIDIILSGQYTHDDDINRVLTETYGEYGTEYGTLEAGLERYFTEQPLMQALINVVDSRRRLIDMARDLSGGPGYCPAAATSEQAALIALQKMGVPLLPTPEKRRGILAILRELRNIREDLTEVEMRHGVPSVELRKYPLEGWTYVEHVLKLTLHFNTHVLEPEIDEEFRRAFQNARDQQSLRPILQSMRGVQKRFLDQPEKPPTRSLSRICKRMLGRESPFEGLDILKYDALVDKCRNFFAHSVAYAVESEGVERVKESIQIAVDLIEDLHRLRISPELIIVTAFGQDAYARKVVWFIREHQFGMYDWSTFSINASWMYKDWQRLEEGGLQLLHAYLCPSPLRNGAFDPVMLDMDEAIEDIE